MAAHEFVTHEMGGVSDFVFLCSDHTYELLSDKKSSGANVQSCDVRELTVSFFEFVAVGGRSPGGGPNYFGFKPISGFKVSLASSLLR